MTEQTAPPEPEDAEGHRRRDALAAEEQGSPDANDAEGHMRGRPVVDDEDDTQGHLKFR
jgi:hypothetical protein